MRINRLNAKSWLGGFYKPHLQDFELDQMCSQESQMNVQARDDLGLELRRYALFLLGPDDARLPLCF